MGLANNVLYIHLYYYVMEGWKVKVKIENITIFVTEVYMHPSNEKNSQRP